MSHKTRVERHIAVDVLASVVGGALVASLLNKSVVAFLLSAAAGLTLFLLERNNIQEEDELDTPFQETVSVAVPQLSEENLEILRKKLRPETTHIPEDPSDAYTLGLLDGASITAEWVLEKVEGRSD